MAFKTNPFASYGGIVCGKRFIGRVNAIRIIRQRIVTDDPGCLAIVGLPRIGKSSLAYQCLIYQNTALHDDKIVPVWIGMGIADTPEAFFRRLILSTQGALEEIDGLTERIKSKAALALEADCPWMEFNHRMQQFFKQVRQAGWRVVFVIDEFDTARIIFDLAAFQAMRELHNYPEWRVAFVTTSRHTIQEIETHADISNLAGIFQELHLGLFSIEETIEMLDVLTDIGLDFYVSDVDFIENKIGLHPYLIAIFAYHLADLWLEYGNTNFEDALDLSTMTYLAYYNQLVNLFHEEGTLDCLRQIASGIINAATKTDMEKLKAYDVIKLGLSGSYCVFSEHLAAYLDKLEQTDSPNFLLQIGQLVGNQYRVLTGPKTTNHSQVVKAWDEHLGRQVAVKCLYVPHGDKDYARELRENLVREGQILAQLNHPNIGSVYNIILDPPSIVMEWVEEMSLQDALREGETFSMAEVVNFGIKLADALNYIHTLPERIVHRDIKPRNIILQKNREPKLIDFDIARARGHQTITQQKDGSFSRIGTVEFSAPEQLTDSSPLGPPADLFSLGVVLYQLHTKKPPYKLGNDPSLYGGQLPALEQLGIPSLLYTIFCKLLCEKPEQRLTAAQLKEELQKYLAANN